MASGASSSLKKMRASRFRQEGNNASSEQSSISWPESHGLGLTLLPRQPWEGYANVEPSTEHSSSIHAPKCKSDDFYEAGDHSGVEGDSLEPLDSSRGYSPRTSSSEQRSKSLRQSGSVPSIEPKINTQIDSCTTRSVCRHPSSARSRTCFLPRSEASPDAIGSVERFDSTSSAHLIGKPRVSYTKEASGEVSAHSTNNTVCLPKERFYSTKLDMGSAAGDFPTLREGSPGQVALHSSRLYNKTLERQSPTTMNSRHTVQKEGKASRSWTKHFPCAVAKNPSSKKNTSLPIFSSSVVKQSAEHKKSNVSRKNNPSLSLHPKSTQQRHPLYFKGGNLVSHWLSSRSCDISHHPFDGFARSDYSDGRTVYCRRRSSSLPNLRPLSKQGKMNASPITYQLATPPREITILPFPGEVDTSPSRITYTEIEACLEDPQFSLVSPTLPTIPLGPKRYLSSSEYTQNNQHSTPLANYSVDCPAESGPKQLYTVLEVNAMTHHLHCAAEKRIQDTREKYEDVNRNLNALIHSNGRLQAAYEKLHSTAADANARILFLQSENKDLKRQLSQASRVNHVTSNYDDFTQESFSEFVAPPAWSGQCDYSKDIAFLDSIFPDNPTAATTSASAIDPSNATENAGSTIDLTTSPPPYRRSGSTSSGRSRFSEDEKRQRKRLANQISRQNAAKKRKLSDQYGAENPFLRQELAKLTTRTGRISKAGGTQL